MENRRIRPRSNHEELMVKKRERETLHAEKWGNAVRYYDKVDKANTKYTDWTSPRYYEEQGKLMQQMDTKKRAEVNLEERRARLRQLLHEEDTTHEVELIRCRAEELKRKKNASDNDVPDELLRSINDTLKLNDEARRKAKAEEALYRQWRGGNPVLRDWQSRENAKSVKLSWLDQQIEKRMAREKEEEQLRMLARERDSFVSEEKRKEEELAREVEAKRKELDEALKAQVAQLKTREAAAKELQRAEEEARRRKCEADNLRAQWEKEETQRKVKEVALFNTRFHKRKLEEKCKQVQQELKNEQEFLEKIKLADIVERAEDAQERCELRRSMDEFNTLITQLRELEEKRKPYIDFTFDSEAKTVYEQFDANWRKEKEMREALMREVFVEIDRQIAANIERNKAEQLRLLDEKEECVDRVRAYREEMDALKADEVDKRERYKRELEEQIKENKLRKRRLEHSERNKVNAELEDLRTQEERIKKEIAKIRGNANIYSNHGRKKAFY